VEARRARAVPARDGRVVRAVVHDRYGAPGVLHLAEVDRPTPREDEVLIRVVATTVNRTDCGVRSGRPLIARPITRMLGIGGLVHPMRRILGSEVAGVVDEVGASVTQFSVGDEVFGVNAGLYGAHAQYVCVRESAPLALRPAGVSFTDAAAVCDGVVLALMGLRAGDVGPGTRVLVYGASGAIGTAAVQLAKHVGASVTAVCATKNLELLRSLGADHVLDYTREDVTTNAETYDVIFDAVGKFSFRRARRSLAPRGVYLATDQLTNLVLALATARGRGRRVRFPIPPRYTKADVVLVKELMESGRYRAVVDRCYPLDQVVEATTYVETGQKTGSVVLLVDADLA